MTPREERIRELAYHMWDQAGRPEGQDQYFWDKAEAEIDVAEELKRKP